MVVVLGGGGGGGGGGSGGGRRWWTVVIVQEHRDNLKMILKIVEKYQGTGFLCFRKKSSKKQK